MISWHDWDGTVRTVKINGRQMVPAGKSGGSQTNLSAENLKLIKNDFITNQ